MNVYVRFMVIDVKLVGIESQPKKFLVEISPAPLTYQIDCINHSDHERD